MHPMRFITIGNHQIFYWTSIFEEENKLLEELVHRRMDRWMRSINSIPSETIMTTALSWTHCTMAYEFLIPIKSRQNLTHSKPLNTLCFFVDYLWSCPAICSSFIKLWSISHHVMTFPLIFWYFYWIGFAIFFYI